MGPYGSHSTAADGYAAMDLATCYGTRQRNHKIRVIILRLPLPVAKILHLVTGPTQHPQQILLQRKTAVVRGDSE